MSKIRSKNSYYLSLDILRSGMTTFKDATIHEISKDLNRVGQCCLNTFALTALFVMTMATVDPEGFLKTPRHLGALYALSMWLQLLTIRHRRMILLLFVLMTEFVIIGMTVHTLVGFCNQHVAEVKDFVSTFLFFFATAIRCVYMLILFKLLTFKNPRFVSRTVFLKPTNTPVTFSSVMAPQELDPTNPYFPQTVYNDSNNNSNLINKSVL